MFSLCNLYDETPFLIFYECNLVKCLWSDIVRCFQNCLVLPTLTPQTIIFGILDSVSNISFFGNNKVFVSYVLLIFKLYVYKTREKKFININSLIAEIRKVKKIEKEIALNNYKKTNAFTKKWHLTDNIISVTRNICAQEILMKNHINCM